MKTVAKPSRWVQDLGTKIEQATSARLIDFNNYKTAPADEWIPENEMSAKKAIKLRTAEQTKDDSGVMKLQQFNPSFFLLEKNEIRCRVPGCSMTTPRVTSHHSQHSKQDLFLCEDHRTKLANQLSKRCEQEEVIVSAASYKHEDFNGYTCLIGAFEKAYWHLLKRSATLNMPIIELNRNTDHLLAEVYLNARNFLLITNALLNPNDDNLNAVLPASLAILERIMSDLTQSDLLERLVSTRRWPCPLLTPINN